MCKKNQSFSLKFLASVLAQEFQGHLGEWGQSAKLHLEDKTQFLRVFMLN